MTPLKNSWLQLYNPIVEHMKLDMRMNLKTRKVEIKNRPETEDTGALQKAADFVQAFVMGFEPQDAIALLRLDDLYVEVRSCPSNLTRAWGGCQQCGLGAHGFAASVGRCSRQCWKSERLCAAARRRRPEHCLSGAELPTERSTDCDQWPTALNDRL